jgi:hypothetical protein
MDKKLVDIVNFNADASCLSSEKWLNCLKGGVDSYFYNWLFLYVKCKKKISLGLIGATIADIKHFNPESIELINSNQDIFEIILRPWSHDIGIYRENNTFLFNVKMGITIIEKEFKNVARYFLSPEFIINSKQIELLSQFNIEAIFINPNRYDRQSASRISKDPYVVKGTSGTLMNCISINGITSGAFLKSIQVNSKNKWSNLINDDDDDIVYSWRDGESSFLLPNGINRELFWLESEDKNIKRTFLNNLEINYIKNEDLDGHYYKVYPMHPFLAWTKEMKMLWYLDKVSEIEKTFESLTVDRKIIFIHMINSDILASVEKSSPEIDIIIIKEVEKFTIYRQEKGLEGEEYLSIFNSLNMGSSEYFMKKFKARRSYLKKVI